MLLGGCMMLTERQRKILGILREHNEGITSEALARHCGVSSKTVRNELKLIGSELDSNIAVRFNIGFRQMTGRTK